ncbi:MAG: hypothetical protein U0Q12_22160 [Vicinamibacterales bacterium]
MIDIRSGCGGRVEYFVEVDQIATVIGGHEFVARLVGVRDVATGLVEKTTGAKRHGSTLDEAVDRVVTDEEGQRRRIPS